MVSKSDTALENVDNGSGEMTDVVKNKSASALNVIDASVSSNRRTARPPFNPILQKILTDYDDTIWPTYYSDTPTMVDINVHILRMGSFDASRMEYTMDIYLRQAWNDPRLNTSKYGFSSVISFTGHKFLQRIWKPDIFFLNAKSANFHDVTVPNILLRLTPEGRILTSIRLSLRLSCHMFFHRFPLDTQNCSITFGPFAQPMDQMVLRWRTNDPLTAEILLQPEFEIDSMTPIYFVRQMNITGNFSFLKVEFILHRRSGYHLVQTYLPTFLIVTISWVSFWLNPDATPARVTLGVTTLLALTTVASGVRSKLPPVSYVKAIDVWIGTCSIMVFGALLEFTLVNYLSRSKIKSNSSVKFTGSGPDQLKKEEILGTGQNSGKFSEPARTEMEMSFMGKAETIKKYNESGAKKVDQASRFIFPFVFLVFNITYWTVYLYIPK